MDPTKRIQQLEAQLAARDAAAEARLAAKDAVIEVQQATIERLERKVTELTQQVALLLARLGKNSRNSHLPPSSDGPGQRPGPGGGKPPPSGKPKRARGGQPGHRGARRAWVPAERVDAVVDLFPPTCDCCGEDLPKIPDASARRYQVTEIPPLRPHVTEFRGHAVGCSCGAKTRARVDRRITHAPFGPRLMSIVGLLVGVYHVSRRKTAALLGDVLGMPISLGAVSAIEARVSEAVAPAVAEARATLDAAPVKHADATTWLNAGQTRSLWTVATREVTVFDILADGASKTIRPLFGTCRGTLVSDRASVFSFWPMSRRQVCWAHLKRKFVSFAEGTGETRRLGQQLLEYTSLLFGYWHGLRRGSLGLQAFRDWMKPVRSQLEACLARGAAAGIAHVSGSCADILAHQPALWRFVDHAGIEPTNNHAERELRGFVTWRKASFGAQSARGDTFAARLMTVAHTARKQGKQVLAFLLACCLARREGGHVPSLLAGPHAAAA